MGVMRNGKQNVLTITEKRILNEFYTHGSVHRKSTLIIVFRQDATYLNYVLVLKAACFTDCSQSIPEAVITAVPAAGDGCQHPKHVELPTEM